MLLDAIKLLLLPQAVLQMYILYECARLEKDPEKWWIFLNLMHNNHALYNMLLKK